MSGSSGRADPAVRVRRVEGSPVVSVRVWLAGGRRAEEIPGLGLVTGRLLAEGTAARTWKQIARQAEGRGAVVESGGSAEGIELAVDALADDWRRAVDWAAELALEPAFPEERLQWTVRQVAAELTASRDDAETKTARAFLDQLYHPNPRARPLEGDLRSLSRISVADCRRFHRSSVRRGCVVAVTGEVDEEAVARRTEERFGPARGRRAADRPPPPPRGRRRRRREVQLPSGEQAHLFVGHLTVPIDHPDFFPLRLLGVILGSGAGLSGRIPQRVRERDGLAYAAHADAVSGAGREPGRLEIYLGTAPERVARSLAAVEEELHRLLDGGVEEEELEAARAFLLGRLPFLRETAGQWAEILLRSEVYGMPWEQLEWIGESLRAVDRSRLEATARCRLSAARLRVTVGLPG